MSVWVQDFCTVCDKQCAPGEMYCSHECRINDETTTASSKSASSSSVDLGARLNSAHASDGPQDRGRELSREPGREIAPSSSPKTRMLAADHASDDRNANKFLYESPMLRPSHTNTPPLSPLLIPVSEKVTEREPQLAQSSHNYRRWLGIDSHSSI